MDTSAKDCLHLFDTSVEGRLEGGWARGVLRQRVKSIKHGPMLDVECYPIWDTTLALRAKQEAKKEMHRRAQERLNRENAKKRLIRLVNANFGADDMIICCTYPDGKEPADDEQARKDVVNYLKRIKYARAKRGLPQIRYIYITEVKVSRKGEVRYHHHIIMSGGLSREEAEEKWLMKHGGRCNTKKAQPDVKWLTGFACYLTEDKRERTPETDGKNPQERAMKRGWNPSKNLVDPEKAATTADKKISIRKAQRIAEAMKDVENVKEIFGKLWPDYELVVVQGKPELTVRQSKWTVGVYIQAQLRRKDTTYGDKSAGGAGDSHGKRGAAVPVSLGKAAGGQIPGIKHDVPHTKRRKARTRGGGAV